MSTLFPIAGLALALLLFAILRHLDALPGRAADAVRRERERDERKTLDALQEATALRVGKLTTSLRVYEEQIAANLRSQIAAAEARARAAETRARVAEREAAEAASILSVASELLRNVRATHDRLGDLPVLVAALRDHRAAACCPPEHAAPDADEARQTVEIRPPPSTATPSAKPANDDEFEEEMTQVATCPAIAGGAAS